MKAEPDGDWFDLMFTEEKETAAFWINKGYIGMLDEMDRLKEDTDSISWGAYKNTHISHLIPNLTPFGRFNIPIGGGKGIVNAAASDWGPGWRMIVEMGPETKATGIYPGGQSGNPGSKFYDNFVDKWASGEYLSVDLREKSDTAAILFQTQFTGE
jgi:penicillin amidase